MKKLLSFALMLALLWACQQPKQEQVALQTEQKAVVYQVFTRLFGNTNTNNKTWATIEENGVGKFNDFTDKALIELKDLGVTHMWYTGVPHHAVINNYTAYGISNDDPDAVKGRAGSPYAVKDYYQVNPDLADDPDKRLDEFKALIERTHKHGMKVLIDIVPNHVARHYEGKNNPEGVLDFGATDDTSVEYAANNNFYYIPGETFKVPAAENNYQPLGGEKHPLSDGQFDENPAKWTGNGSRLAQPGFHDWYETVKINYGVRPDGTFDFPFLPEDYDQMDEKAHFDFWQDKQVPDSWIKFRDIALYWTKLGVDGFRFDMAEMVPVEFWSFMNSSIKNANPDAFLLAEVYNPSLYRDYIHKGKMDYLYDKVELYDTLKHIMQGHGLTDNLPAIQEGLKDIEHHMLHFLENHDEQRIASPEFVGDADKGMPAMVVSTCISTAPTMLYFGQEVGEPGAEDAGFGSNSRTSIFDYIGVPHHQRWMNNGAFDGGQLSDDEKALRDFYKRLLTFSTKSTALMGEYEEIHSFNRANTEGYGDKVFSFVRWSGDEKLIITSSFKPADAEAFSLKVPAEIIKKWGLKDGSYQLTDVLYGSNNTLKINNGVGSIKMSLQPLESFIYQLQ
ncbi:alpha-amylase family protein [Carboxylicivirga marina]|uniref:Alpha-amylase family protein n=1 Tax=Carboxylicivirga marina TaxID=2800988 RepID=A0ABS1HGY3_9BACT|nr:alpha-amylase family protein [Carboxylicivirga marina]MBK3516817.1 alpha-amylase family protein [Carboxylicivirga marina]